MYKIGIVGASGYTGVELARLLVNHPDVELSVATSRQYAGQKLSDVYPNLRGLTDIVLEDVVIEDLVGRADLFWLNFVRYAIVSKARQTLGSYHPSNRPINQ